MFFQWTTHTHTKNNFEKCSWKHVLNLFNIFTSYLFPSQRWLGVPPDPEFSVSLSQYFVYFTFSCSSSSTKTKKMARNCMIQSHKILYYSRYSMFVYSIEHVVSFWTPPHCSPWFVYFITSVFSLLFDNTRTFLLFLSLCLSLSLLHIATKYLNGFWRKTPTYVCLNCK